MRQLTFGENMTVFLLFFGVAVLESFASKVWWRVAFWGVIAILFAALAWMGQRRKSGARSGSPRAKPSSEQPKAQVAPGVRLDVRDK